VDWGAEAGSEMASVSRDNHSIMLSQGSQGHSGTCQALPVTQLAVTFMRALSSSMETLLPMAVRFRLAELLEETGLSQRELASRSGVSPTTINRMANNLTGQVSLKTLESLASALSTERRRIEPGDLIERVPDRKRKRG